MIPLLALVFAAALLGSAALMLPGNPFAVQAVPDARSLHERPTPSGGGAAVILVLAVADAGLRLFRPSGAPAPWLLPHPNLIAAVLLLAAISWADDRRPLAPLLRLVVHVGAAALALGSALTPPLAPLAAVAVLLLIVWCINLFNFMDGMDGFAGGMAVIGFGALGLFARSGGSAPLALTCFAIAAASGGFLVWNFPPARIFLGDVGSAPLGFLAAVCALWGVGAGAFGAAVPLLVFAPFWVDATLTLARRALRRERIWEAHRTHAYQRLARAGWGHRRTTLAEYALMLACALAAALYESGSASRRAWILGAVALAFALLVGLVRRIERKNLAG
jgi:UDP-N-acetylmuramyl pentapeptide phosphotransferase/UDP-N-acetylglucosamine-1-phosphate transferase